MRNLFLSTPAFSSLESDTKIDPSCKGTVGLSWSLLYSHAQVGFNEHCWVNGWMYRCINEFKVMSTDEFIPHANTAKAVHLWICARGSQ